LYFLDKRIYNIIGTGIKADNFYKTTIRDQGSRRSRFWELLNGLRTLHGLNDLMNDFLV
jgi:hypothetical protein